MLIISAGGPRISPGGGKKRGLSLPPLLQRESKLLRDTKCRWQREKQHTYQSLTSTKTLCVRVHLAFIIMSKPELMILKVCFRRSTFVCPGAQGYFPRPQKNTFKALWKAYTSDAHFNLSCMCTMKHFRINVSRKKSTKIGMSVWVHMYECVHCAYGREGCFGVFNRDVILSNCHYFFAIFISMTIQWFIRLYIKCMYISSVHFISIYALLKMW